MNDLSGAQALVSVLADAGVTTAFTVPGESFLAVLDALHHHPTIRTVATRHEGAAAFMAEATAKLTKRPSVCMATRAVGATNLAIGLHTAMQDSSPVIALLGQVPTSRRGREAFQEVDLVDVFRPLVKWSVEPTRADRLAEIVNRAVRVAQQGRPGPVVISLPEDILREPSGRGPALRTGTDWMVQPSAGDARRVLAELRRAQRPVLMVGGGVIAAGATDTIAELASREAIGVVTGWRRGDAFPNSHACFLGQTGLRAAPAVRDVLLGADLAIVIGHRLDENSTLGYQFPSPKARLVHVDVDPNGITSPLGADESIIADAASFAVALLSASIEDPPVAAAVAERRTSLAERRARWETETTPDRGRARAGYADQQAVTAHIRRLAPDPTIFTCDAGTFSGWFDRYLRFERPGSVLAPISGAMGYAIPAAIAAKLSRPDHTVIAYVGDGGFLMTGAEIETAVREDLPFVAVVFDNSAYATIRVHQEREYPGRPVATGLGRVDFAAFAESLGGCGFRVDDDTKFPEAFEAALASGRPSVIHVVVDPEQTSVNADAPA